MYQARARVTVDGRPVEKGTGRLPRTPDRRDYTAQTSEIQGLAMKLGLKDGVALPDHVDISGWDSPIEDQGSIGSCTAQAAVGIVEHLQRRAHGIHLDGSRLFVYKTTRNLMGVDGDTGGYLRTAMAALRLCGVPPEQYWPYSDGPNFDESPSPFVYSLAEDFEAVSYFCHDPATAGIPFPDVLASVKGFAAAGIPSMFGFYGARSFDFPENPGEMPLPGPTEPLEWGHAVVVVGYDDERTIRNTFSDETTVGAFKVRNSWGTGWGEGGYGWLPYQYVLEGLADDFWSLISVDWVDTKNFGL